MKTNLGMKVNISMIKEIYYKLKGRMKCDHVKTFIIRTCERPMGSLSRCQTSLEFSSITVFIILPDSYLH